MDEVTEIARRQIGLAIATQSRQVEETLAGIQADCSARGYLKSGTHFLLIDKACGEAIRERAERIWEIVHRCVESIGVEFYPGIASELKAFVLTQLNGTAGELTDRAASTAAKFCMHKNIQDHLTEAETARVSAVQWLEAEIDLFCTVLSKSSARPQYSPQPIINITGSQVGSVQTGSHSSATVTQSATNSIFGDTLTALQKLKSELIAAGLSAATPEVVELVDESTSELVRPAPSKAKLSAFLDSIKSSLSGAVERFPKIAVALESVSKSWEICKPLIKSLPQL